MKSKFITCGLGALWRKPLSLGLTMLVACQTSHAAEGGFSNYVPGFYGDIALAVAPPEGVSIRNDLYHYSGDARGTVRSGNVEASVDVDLTYNYTSIFYNPGIELLGAQFVAGIVPTFGYVDIEAELQGTSNVLSTSDDILGLGDLTLAGNFYWNDDKWSYVWANFVVVPIGEYDENDIANTGLNYWTFETDFMVNYLNPESGADYSIVVGYGYNTENNDTDYQSGDEFHVDVVLNQFLTERLAVGISGFFYRQLSGDSGKGALLGDFKGEAAGIGPGIYWTNNIAERDVWFSLKWLSEFDVKNRLEGDHVFASFALTF